MSNHLWLDFHLIEFLARVNANNATNHLWNNNHIAKVCLDKIRLLIGLGLGLGLAQLLDQTHWLALQTH